MINLRQTIPIGCRRLARVAALAAVSGAVVVGALAAPADAVVSTGHADLQVAIATSWHGTVPGGTLQTFTTTVTNVGTAPSTSQTYLYESWPQAADLDMTASPALTCFDKPTQESCVGPSLQPGQSLSTTYTFLVRAGFTGSGEVGAEVDYDTNELNLANNLVTVASNTSAYATTTSIVSIKATAAGSPNLAKVAGTTYVPVGTEIAVTVKAGTASGTGVNDGTVSLIGPEGGSSARVDANGYATLKLKPVMRGVSTYLVCYGGTPFYLTSTAGLSISVV
jgi:hypothetical protein